MEWFFFSSTEANIQISNINLLDTIILIELAFSLPCSWFETRFPGSAFFQMDVFV